MFTSLSNNGNNSRPLNETGNAVSFSSNASASFQASVEDNNNGVSHSQNHQHQQEQQQPEYQFSSLQTNPYYLPYQTVCENQDVFDPATSSIASAYSGTSQAPRDTANASLYNQLKSSSTEKLTEGPDDYYLTNSLPLSPINFDYQSSQRSSKTVAGLSTNSLRKQASKQQQLHGMSQQPSRQTNSTPNGKFKTNYELADFEEKFTDDKLVIGQQVGGVSADYMERIYKKLMKSDPSTRNPFIQVKLETRNLWEEFSSIGTEMIITKCGRFVLWIVF